MYKKLIVIMSRVIVKKVNNKNLLNVCWWDIV